MKKTLVLLALVVCAIAGISCNGGKSTTANTLKFWHFYSEPSQKAALTQMIQEFEKANNCKVELTELSWNDGKTKLLAAFNSNTAPDVLELGSDWVAQFSSGGVLEQLDAKGVNTANFVDWSLAPCKWNSKLYALPWTVDTRVLYVNKDLLEKAGINTMPSTMQQVLEMSGKIQQGDVSGFGCNGPDAHKLYKRILPFFWSAGGDVFDAGGNCVVNSPENIKALDLYVQLSRVGNIGTQKELDMLFSQGKLAFWYSGGWLNDKIRNENPLLEFAVMPLPGYENHEGISFAGGEYLAMNAKSEKKELALKLMQYLSDGNTSISFCKTVTEAGFPADKRYFNDNFFASHPIRSVFAKQLEHARMTPVFAKWLDVEAIIESAAVEALYGKKTAEEALNDAHYRITILNRNLTAR